MKPCNDNLTNDVLDSIESQIAVIDRKGAILYVNQAWIDFGQSNGLPLDHPWIGMSYLDVCRLAADGGDLDGTEALSRFRSVLEGRLHSFVYEYPCHSPVEQRWFMMRVVPLRGHNDLIVVSHHIITERKLAEARVEQQNQELERLATTDKLTQLLNRFKLDEILEAEIERAKRYHTPLSLVMVDIDLFKEVNDTFGHRTGDVVLLELARLMRASVRKSDSVGRWGGEEFLILMPGSDVDASVQLAEKLRKKIANHTIQGIGQITCSFGVAHFRNGLSISEFIEYADSALYQAKRNGRNRVELSSTTVHALSSVVLP